MRPETAFPDKITLGALVLGVGMAFPATSADALSINFVSSAGPSYLIEDNVTNDTDPLSGQVGAEDFTVGGFTITSVSAAVTDIGLESKIASSAIEFSGGNADINETLTMTTTSSGFTNGAAAPSQSDLFFSIATSELGGTIDGDAEIGGTALGTLSFDPADGNAVSDSTSDLAVLSDGFDMSSTLVFGAQSGTDATSFTSTVSATAPIPLPAGAWLLLSGIGGMALLRRRRKAA